MAGEWSEIRNPYCPLPAGKPSDSLIRNFYTLSIGYWTLEIGNLKLDIGHWTLDIGN